MNLYSEPLKMGLRDHFCPQMAEDESFEARSHGDGSIVVEFSVAWVDFLLRLIITFDKGDNIGIMRVHDVDRNKVIHRGDLNHPRAIEELFEVIEREWDVYLCREPRH